MDARVTSLRMPKSTGHAGVPRIAILGTRGVPAAHGGFETFVETLAPYLARRGWQVRVYCQIAGTGEIHADEWQGVERVIVPVSGQGPWGTVTFDWRAMRHACAARFPLLVFGYNTAVFSILPRLHGIHHAMNMDGIEWRRQKWTRLVRFWFYCNEIAGCLLANELVADHPRIAAHLHRWAAASKVHTIPYGADADVGDDSSILRRLSLEARRYVIVIARPEPENLILEMVRAFGRIESPCRMVVLGDLRPDSNDYHRRIRAAAGSSVLFPGAIYDRRDVGTLRRHARLYLHGHQVGGTNPSLVEALAHASPVLAHDNEFNRWVAGSAAAYFSSEASCEARLRELLEDDGRLAAMSDAARARHADAFTWDHVLPLYESVCRRMQIREHSN
ncbi:MAG: DUF1972 domain-containing protein [Gammaproteobacteria bacterium]